MHKYKELVVILHNLRSAHNVGSIFRTADASATSKIYLTGYSPAPKDRFGRKQKDIAKVALGAEDYIVWDKRDSLEELVLELKEEGFLVIAVEQAKNSIDHKKIRELKTEKLALIFGNEPEGLEKEALALADYIAEIAMYGQKESLNVSSAFAIVVYSLLA